MTKTPRKTRDVIKLIWNNGKCLTYNFDDKIYGPYNSQKQVKYHLQKKLKVLE